MTKYDIAANIAFFLLERTGSIYGEWSGNLSAKEQREMFGHFIGKGWFLINGATEEVRHTVKVAYGMDYETTFYATFNSFDVSVEKDVAHKEEKKARAAMMKARREERC